MDSLRDLTKMLKAETESAKFKEAAEISVRSRHFIDSNRASLFEQYRDRWIAVYNDSVVATDMDLRLLVATLRAIGVPLEHVTVDLLSSEPHPIHLWVD
jgi:ribosomal protein L20